MTESEFKGFFLQNLHSRATPLLRSRDTRHQFDNNAARLGVIAVKVVRNPAGASGSHAIDLIHPLHHHAHHANPRPARKRRKRIREQFGKKAGQNRGSAPK